MTAVKPEIETIEDCVYGNDCPIHVENPHFNAKVLAAITEGDAIFNGEKPANMK